MGEQRLEEFIAGSAGDLVEEWREFCRIPSVSGDLEPIGLAADWIQQRLAPLMDEVRRTDIPGWGPVVMGRLQGDDDRALLLYCHYDTQPSGDPELWSHSPFGAELHDGAVYARGACDDKADVASRLQALSFWLDGFEGRPPFSIVVVADPAEEMGSPGLREALAENAEFLRSEACLWESYLREEDGRPAVGFGCRGMLEVSLSATLLSADQHTSLAPIARSAPAALLAAIASLSDSSGRIVIEGFAADADVPTDEQRAYADSIALPADAMALAGVSPLWDVSEEELKQRWIFEPGFAIGRVVINEDGIGRIPAAAAANVRFNIVPSMTPERCVAALRAHLDSHGFAEIAIAVETSVLPASSPVDTPFAHSVIEAARETWGEPVVYPLMTGVGPGRILLDVLGTPLVSPTGTLRPEGNMHATNEHGYVVDYLDHLRFTVRLLDQFAARLS